MKTLEPSRRRTGKERPVVASLLLGCVLLGVLYASLVDVLPTNGDEPDLTDPVELRRIRLPANKLVAALKQLKSGILVRMARSEFETLVQDAARSRRDLGRPPRLTEATYRARLEPDLAIKGTAQWKLSHPGASAALLRLAPTGGAFNLAITRPRYENREAIVARFPLSGKSGQDTGPALLLEQQGEHTLMFDWSARAEARPEGLFVDLRVPDCPIATLELNLPTDRTLSARDDTLVTGPHPAEAGDRRLWKVICGNRTSVPLLVRKGSVPGTLPAVLLVRQRTIQKLGPDGVQSTHSLSFEAVHREVNEVICECPAYLRPVEVNAQSPQATKATFLDRWEWRAPARAGLPALVVVRFTSSVREATIEIRGLAPLGGVQGKPVAWGSPGMSLRDSVPRGETLEVWLHPDLRLSDWHTGDFRLVDSTTVTDDERQTRWRRLTLSGGGLATQIGKNPPVVRRPRASLVTGGVEFRAHQHTWWRLGDRVELTTRISYSVRRGLLFSPSISLPAGWEVEGVELTPSGLLRSWGVRADRSLLIVELRRPIRATEKEPPTLTVRLRPTKAVSIDNRDLPFPDLVPLGARFREGELAIAFDHRLYAPQTRTSNLPSSPGVGPVGKEWSLCYSYRGETPSGTLRLVPRPPRVQAIAALSVYAGSNRVALETRLRLQAVTGRPTSVDVHLTDSGPWNWRVIDDTPAHQKDTGNGLQGNGVRSAARLHHVESALALAPLAARNPLQALLLLAARPRGSLWRLTFEQPLTPGNPIVLQSTQGLLGGKSLPAIIQVPLVSVTTSDLFKGEVSLHLQGEESPPRTSGLTEVSPEGTHAWRRYLYSRTLGGINLTLSLPALKTSNTQVDQASLTSILGPGANTRHHFRFRLRGWNQRTFPVQLPQGARLEGVAVDGSRLEKPQSDTSLELPVPAGPEATFDLVWSMPAQARIWNRLSVALPELPLKPSSVRRRFLLPAGMVPLRGVPIRRYPELMEQTGWGLPRRLDDLLGAGKFLTSRLSSRSSGGENQELNEASDSLRAANVGEVMRLDVVVKEIAFTYLKGSKALLIDTQALGKAGVGPDASLLISPPSPDDHTLPWETRGLKAISRGEVVLLTTATEHNRWPRGEEDWPEGLRRAIREAARTGQDSSGRFLTALEWLRQEPTKAPGWLSADGLEGWSEWELPGDEETIVVVQRKAVTSAGLVVSGLLLLVLVALRNRPTACRRLLIAAMIASGILLPWLPDSLRELAWWPVLCLTLVGLVWYSWWVLQSPRRSAAPTTARPTGRSSRSGLVAGMILLTAIASLAFAAYPPPVATKQTETVYILPGPADKPQQETVLVTPALLKNLRTLASAGKPPEKGAVLTAASYEGKRVDGKAEIDAVFQVHALSDDQVTLDLPLGGVSLAGEVYLDGVRTYPKATKTGYSLAVRGKGKHKVELKFRVPITGQAEGGDSTGMRHLQFSAPPVVQNRLVFNAGSEVSHLQVPTREGKSKITTATNSATIEVDLGAVTRPVVVRWYQQSKKPRAAKVQFREAYLWDLRSDASTLTARLQYTITQAAVPSLEVSVPPDLEVRSCEARRTAGTLGSVVRLSDWVVSGTGSGRQVRLEFPSPVTGGVEVTLELVPRHAWSGSVLLPLPKPRGQAMPKQLSHLAYRVSGVEATRTNWLRLTGIRPMAYAPFWPTSSRPPGGPLDYASTFSREQPQPPELRLQLRPIRPLLRASQDVTVVAGPRQAEVKAVLRLSAPNKDLALVEWEVLSPQPLTVAEITGLDVRQWSQSGNRLFVWLEGKTGSTTLELTGWVPLVPSPKGGESLAKLDLPCLRVPSAARTDTQLSLETTGNLTVKPQSTPQLTPIGQPNPDRVSYQTRAATWGGTALVVASKPAVVSIETMLRRKGNEVRFTTTIIHDQPRELRRLTVRLRHWQGKTHLEAPRVARRREQSTRGAGHRERVWTLELQPGVRGRYRLVITGSVPLDEVSGGLLAPEVTLPGISATQTVTVDEAFQADAPLGLLPVGPRSWRMDESTWQLRLRPRGPQTTSEVQVVQVERRARMINQTTWSHESTFWVRQPQGGQLQFEWPVPADVDRVRVDGQSLTPAQPRPAQLALALAARPGLRRVSIRWHWRDPEPVARPLLALPRLVGGKNGPVVWTLQIPPAWEPQPGNESTSLGQGATRRAALELWRARVQLEICRDLTADSPDLLSALQRLARSLGLAELALDSGGDGARNAGPDGKTLDAWLQQLKRQSRDLARDQRFEDVFREVQRQTRTGFAEQDLPLAQSVSWQGTVGETAPQPHLTPLEFRRIREAMMVSLLWLGLLGVVVLASSSSSVRVTLRILCPELILLAAGVVWWLVGLVPLVLALGAVGVIGRVWRLRSARSST